MRPVLTEEERKELRAILRDPVKSMELANKAIDAWVLQRPKSRKSSRSSKRHS